MGQTYTPLNLAEIAVTVALMELVWDVIRDHRNPAGAFKETR